MRVPPRSILLANSQRGNLGPESGYFSPIYSCFSVVPKRELQFANKINVRDILLSTLVLSFILLRSPILSHLSPSAPVSEFQTASHSGLEAEAEASSGPARSGAWTPAAPATTLPRILQALPLQNLLPDSASLLHSR